jgi:hypothetical protein
MVGALPLPGAVQAREAGTCTALAQSALSSVAQLCASAAANSVCLGYDSVTATFAASAQPTFKAKGDKVNLADVTSLTTSVANPEAGNWGVAVLKIQADMPEASQGITGVLFGEATLTSAVKADTLLTLPVTTVRDAALLRGGAAQTYPSLVKLNPGQKAAVDGRNKTGDWLRVRLDSAVGWAPANQLNVDGDAKTLAVLEDQDSRAGFVYKNPMQAFTLSTKTAAACGGEAPSGMLLQLTQDAQNASAKPARLMVNGVDLTITSGTMYLRATPKDRLEIAAVNGSATVSALGGSVTLNTGEWVRVRLGGTDGLLAAAVPGAKSKFPFALIDGAPVNALPTALQCMVGLPATPTSAANARVTVRVGPGKDRGSLFFMPPEGMYAVKGQAVADDGESWWKIEADGRDQAWVEQTAVHAMGVCEEVAEAEIPPVLVADTSDSADTNGDVGDSGDAGDAQTGGNQISTGFAPKGPTIWNVNPGQDQLVGTCGADVKPINYCPSLLQLAPRGTSVVMRGMELTPYTMRRLRENVYYYQGPAPRALGRGTIKLTLVFTSEKTWTATRVLQLTNQRGCQHMFTFTGTFLR